MILHSNPNWRRWLSSNWLKKIDHHHHWNYRDTFQVLIIYLEMKKLCKQNKRNFVKAPRQSDRTRLYTWLETTSPWLVYEPSLTGTEQWLLPERQKPFICDIIKVSVLGNSEKRRRGTKLAAARACTRASCTEVTPGDKSCEGRELEWDGFFF